MKCATKERRNEEDTKKGRRDMDFFERREKRGEVADPEAERFANLAIRPAIEVHKHLGAGHAESTYREAMCHELSLRGIPCQHEVPFDVTYKGKFVGKGRIDLLVGDCLVLELKAIEQLAKVHQAQVIGYLVAKNLRLALLINFNVLQL